MFIFQGIGELFDKIRRENKEKENGHMNGDAGLFFTNLYVTPVLRKISLHLEKGEMLALAGSTGSGKVRTARYPILTSNSSGHRIHIFFLFRNQKKHD